jgi:hypothetical protein
MSTFRSKWVNFGGGLATILALGVIAPIPYFRWYIIFGIGIATILFQSL